VHVVDASVAQPGGKAVLRQTWLAGAWRKPNVDKYCAHPARYASPVATFWRYVRIQVMVFIFGCVGPIFLGIYFATQPDPSMKWAYWAGLFITAADVLIALALTNASDPNKAPADVRVALAVAKRMQSRSGRTSDQASSSSTYDPFSSTALTFSTDSGPSSGDYSSSSDYSSSDSGSSSSDSGSSGTD
jgi:hypothetical protein